MDEETKSNLTLLNPEQLIKMNQMQTQQKEENKNTHGAHSMSENINSVCVCAFVWCGVHVGTSLLWFISGQAWLSEGMEGDLLGVTSTGEAE